MKTPKKIKQLFKDSNVTVNSDFNNKVLFDAENKLTKTEAIPSVSMWRIIMKSPITKLAAAAVIIIVAVVIWSIFPTSVIPTAYALQDTIEAYNSIRFLHIRETETIFQITRKSDLWLKCDDYGNATRMRFQADWAGATGPVTVVVGPDGMQAWLKIFNFVLQRQGDVSAILGYDVAQIEPKALFERLCQQEEAGEIILDISEPQEKREPIKVTVTYPQGSRSENWKKVLYVDQATKLVTKIEKFQFGGGQYNHVKTSEFFDYNQQIDPVMFSLAGEVPENANVADMTDSKITLPRGDMTDEEFAREITRQFFEAFISKDYDRAGQLFMAAPGSLLEKSISGANMLEILSIGPAYPDPDPDSNAMLCSCKVLLEFNGAYYELDAWRIRIIQMEDPDRWYICEMEPLVIPAQGELTITYDNIGLDAVTYNGLEPGEFMKKWLILGPMPYPTLGDIDFSSQEGQRIAFYTESLDFVNFTPRVNIDGTEYEWAILESEYGIIGLEQLSEGSNNYTIDYVWAQIDMPEETKGTLGIGSDDGVKVWLNGELIHKNWLYRTVGADNDRVPVLFKKGKNQLVLKIQNTLGYSGFCCRLLDE